MIPPEERRHLEHGPIPGEGPGGAGLVEVSVRSEQPVDQVLDRVREVLLAVVDLPESEWESGTAGSGLPAWFVQGCAPEQTEEELQRWVTWWQSLPPEEQAAAERDQPWALSDWLHWMQPHERTWFWWDGRSALPGEGVVSVEVPGWPAPLGALEWLLKVAGAARVEVLEPHW